MRPIIEFCTNNMHHGTEKLMKQLEQNPDYDVIEYGCLGNCGECYLFPYALVNGEVVAAPTVDELGEQIHAKIKEIEELFDLFSEE
ncbi:MAG: UDP-N-acetylmuramoylalanine--D-glutamate ligase [Bacilli bacterium]|nr:UDP-N-acetylmuramoylalanine--D-glutamate ligase [Bacilli bacterium]